jgi:hypothetical protein
MSAVGSLWGIILNLLLVPGYYDVALRDLGLSFGALALALLASRKELTGAQSLGQNRPARTAA